MQGQERLGTNLDIASGIGRFSDSKMPSFSADTSQVVFIGHSLDNDTDEVYLVTLTGVQETSTVRLTNDTANYSYPALSPDGTRLVVVRENPANAEFPGPDLYLINVVNRTPPEPLTTNQADILETMPRWSPDGSLVIYAAAAEPGGDHDLYIISPDNPGSSGVRVFDDPGDALYPVYGPAFPDGSQYLAYASDRVGGIYNIFIFDMTTSETFELTADDREDHFPATGSSSKKARRAAKGSNDGWRQSPGRYSRERAAARRASPTRPGQPSRRAFAVAAGGGAASAQRRDLAGFAGSRRNQ